MPNVFFPLRFLIIILNILLFSLLQYMLRTLFLLSAGTSRLVMITWWRWISGSYQNHLAMGSPCLHFLRPAGNLENQAFWMADAMINNSWIRDLNSTMLPPYITVVLLFSQFIKWKASSRYLGDYLTSEQFLFYFYLWLHPLTTISTQVVVWLFILLSLASILIQILPEDFEQKGINYQTNCCLFHCL